MTMNTQNPTCWILTEGIAGTENQCLGVAQAMGITTPMVKRIGLKFPWKQLSPYLRWGHQYGVTGDSIAPPYPDLVIASGRKAIGAALHIKKQSPKTFVVQIQDPRIAPDNFDLVVVPQHDPTRGKNVVVSKAALHRVTAEKVAAETEKFKSTFTKLPHPRVAVLIGGNSKKHTMTAENAKMLALQLAHLAESKNVGLMVTASRRTGEANKQVLQGALSGPNTYFWDGQGDNPYFAFLGIADYIIVTEDSVSMTSEALSTGKPVYIASLEGGGKRLDAFHRLLETQGFTRPFTGVLETWSYTPPDDTMRIATEILERLKGH